LIFGVEAMPDVARRVTMAGGPTVSRHRWRESMLGGLHGRDQSTSPLVTSAPARRSIPWRNTSNFARRDKLAYATAAERMLQAIGEPQMVDTRNDPRLSRIFANKVIKIYPAFEEFYGMEEAIEQVVSYFRHAAQGLEEKKQILYLAGARGWRQVVHCRAPEAAGRDRCPSMPSRARR
jgi:hypothetical protein